MKIVLSRKGFDSAAGKVPSPIVDGRPISMPIPATRNSVTTYDDVGLGDLVERVTKGRIGRNHLCHHDPMFADGECIFGQCDAAQSHLANQGVGVGDVFVFFGLFCDEATRERHHRIFGYMKVEQILRIDGIADNERADLERLRHPHVFGVRSANNTVYRGEGATATKAPDALRLTKAGAPLSRWVVPEWLQPKGLSYHAKTSRWIGATELDVVARGQEFVCDVGDDPVPLAWLETIIGQIHS